MAGSGDWRIRLREMETNACKDIDAIMDRKTTAHNNDVGLVGKNGGGVFVRDDSSIEIFSKEGLGIKIDPDSESISFYCNKFNVYTKQFDMYTDMMGFKWNKFPINLAFILTGGCSAGPVVVNPGTLMMTNTAMQDVSKFVSNTVGALMKLGGQ
jgi:hypothetical protein